MEEILKRAQYWATDKYFDEETRKEVQKLLDENNEKELIDRFYTDLEFGTGGLRGIIGSGSNRMNIYTVRRATQGLANYILRVFPDKQNKVVISYDNRHFSFEFAKESASVLAANNIKAYIFKKLTPTPVLSFAVRFLNCTSGIMITASHNPKEYNGYKVYWNDGAQVVPPHDKEIISEVLKIDSFDKVRISNFDEELAKGNIKFVGENEWNAYYKMAESIEFNKEYDKNIKIVYTPLHGTGFEFVKKVLQDKGFTNLYFVDEQTVYDPDFSTAKSPNPENKEALELLEKRGRELDADLLVATDPDSDRMAAVVKHNNDFYYLNGNQICTLLTYYICDSLTRNNRMPQSPFVVSTVVTTELLNKITESFNVELISVLTGFKWIAERIRYFEGQKDFIFGSEESYGFLVEDFVRDKDGITAVYTIAEMVGYYKLQNNTLVDVLYSIYDKYGFFLESLVNIHHKGAEGQEKINAIMKMLRENPPKKLLGSNIIRINDHLKQEFIEFPTGKIGKLPQPKSNVLAFYTEEGYKVSARPSGTEPKIKFYFSVQINDNNLSIQEKEKKAKEILKELENEFLSIVEKA